MLVLVVFCGLLPLSTTHACPPLPPPHAHTPKPSLPLRHTSRFDDQRRLGRQKPLHVLINKSHIQQGLRPLLDQGGLGRVNPSVSLQRRFIPRNFLGQGDCEFSHIHASILSSRALDTVEVGLDQPLLLDQTRVSCGRIIVELGTETAGGKGKREGGRGEGEIGWRADESFP